MLHIDELQNLYLVAHFLQHIRTQGVRHKGSHALPYQSVFQNGLKLLAGNLPVQLMLTAGHHHNDACIPFYRFFYGVIGCRVAGMECHHHVHLVIAFVGADVAPLKMQVLVAVLLCQPVAKGNHILLQIQTRNLHFVFPKHMQVIIHGKGKVRFSASEVNDAHRSVCWKLTHNVLDKFQITVNLAELIVLRLYDFALRGLHAESH